MTSNEVLTSLIWIVAGGYVLYVGWTVHRITANRSARRRHPSSYRAPAKIDNSGTGGGL